MVAFLSQADMPDELFGHALAVGTYAPVLMACVEPKQLARSKADYTRLLLQVPPLVLCSDADNAHHILDATS